MDDYMIDNDKSYTVASADAKKQKKFIEYKNKASSRSIFDKE